jgi:hypothetical protein
MLHDTSMVLSSSAQLATVDGESSEHCLPVTDDRVCIPTISNRVTTLSTIGSVENSSLRLSLDKITPEPNVPEF